MSYIRKGLALLLLAATLLTVLIACAEKPAEGGETKAPEVQETEAETKITANLPDLDLEGYLFSVVHWYDPNWESRRNVDIYAESQTGDTINDAVYQRNTRLTEKYDFEIEFTEIQHSELNSKVRQLVNTNDDVYDLVYQILAETPGFTTDGDFLDFETSFEYCDLDQPYWDNNVRKELSFAEHTFLMASSYNIIDEDATAAVAFNKQIAADENLPSFYDFVNQGTWTFEEIYNQMSSFDGDINGDMKMTEADDIYGFLGGNDVASCFFFGGGGRLTEKDEYDYPYYVFGTEENYDIYSSMLDIMYSPVFLNHHMIKNEEDNYYRQLFIDGHGLFFWMRMDDARAMRGEEAINFGILPTPKYTEDQENYLSLISRYTCGLMSVLICEQDAETVGFIMEAMAAASYYDLTRAYYDVTLKTRSARDDESLDMLDIIFSHRVTDIGDVFDFGGFGGQLLNFPKQNPGKYTIASTYASNENRINSDIEKFIKQVEKLDWGF